MKVLLISVLSFFTFADNYSERGKEALLPLKKSLMKELKAGLKSHGAMGALKVCNIKAMDITDSKSTKKYKVGRSSLKNRNPKNAPSPWMSKALIDYEKTKSKKPRVIRIDSDKTAYVEPIYLKGLCLTCHGGQISSSLKKEINSLYPLDKATGYKAGDFRGIFWVEFN